MIHKALLEATERSVMMQTTTGNPFGEFLAVPTHIPNGRGGAYKTEVSLFRSARPVDFDDLPPILVGLIEGLTGKRGVIEMLPLLPEGGITHIRLTWWHEPDPRTDPHNHPWSFRSLILSGGYTEQRADGRELIHRPGDINDVGAFVFHCVTAVLPQTVTLMFCGDYAKGGEWGHIGDGGYVPAKAEPAFLDAIRSINPHKR